MQEGGKARSAVAFVRTENAGKTLRTIKRNPSELPAVIIQEPRRKTHAFPRSDVGQCSVMIRAVEIADFFRSNQSVLHRSERRRGTAADHQGSSVKVAFMNNVFFGKRFVLLRNQIDAAFEQFMHRNARQMTCKLLQRK